MRVPALTARHIEYARFYWKSKNFEDTRRLVAIALGCEKEPVLQEIVGVEGGLPPLALPAQKNTGSR
jgi:hypothetical protein